MKSSQPKRRESYSKAIDVENQDVIITDPGYLVRHDAWKEFCRSLGCAPLTPEIREISGIKMLVADTIFGDWACRLHRLKDGKATKPIGTFTADAGMVCAALISESEMPQTLPRMCYTVIPKFTGRIIISHRKGTCHVEGIGSSKGRKLQFASRQYA